MPKYKRTEFIEYLGLDPNDKKNQSMLSMNKKRGKLVIDEDGTIDTNNETNRVFIAERIQQPTRKLTTADNLPAPAPKAKIKVLASEDTDTEILEIPKDIAELLKKRRDELAKIDKAEEILKKRSTTKLNELKIQKTEGELIPTELVKLVISRFAKSIYVAFENEMEKFITDVGKAAGFTNEIIAKYRGELINTINQAITDSIENGLKEVDNIVAEYSDTRGRGEKK